MTREKKIAVLIVLGGLVAGICLWFYDLSSSSNLLMQYDIPIRRQMIVTKFFIDTIFGTVAGLAIVGLRRWLGPKSN